jgi:Tol biopolymer transport system component/DNA-binding winged helix-turn-helix (wHTH) protein
MRNQAPPRKVYAFGPFEADPSARVLTRDGARVDVTPRLFDLLIVLIEHSGLQDARVATKDELMAVLWPNSVVEEANLSQNVFWLRKALGQKGNENRYVVTVPGQGYAFVEPVAQRSAAVRKSPNDSGHPAARRAALAAAIVTLAAFGALLTTRREPGESSQVAIRRIAWGNEIAAPGSVSRDGRWICYTTTLRDGRESIIVRNVVTGKSQLVTPELPVGGAYRFAKLSPDGSRLAFIIDGTLRTGAQLHTVRVNGAGAPHALHKDPDVDVLGPLDWSPDSRRIVAALHRRGETDTQIVEFGLDTSTFRTIKVLNGGLDGPWRVPAPTFSPDGLNIAYSYPPEDRDAPSDIFLVPTAGGKEHTIVADPANDRIIGWSEDGRMVFASNRAGTRDLWAMPVHNGQASGPPLLVQRNLTDAIPLGVTRSGSFFYQTNQDFEDVNLVQLSAAAGQVISGPASVDRRHTGKNRLPDWSPDGRFLAYLTDQGVRIRTMSTGEEREIRATLPKWVSTMRWFPDGASLLVAGNEQGPVTFLYRLNLRTGKLSLLLDRDVGDDSGLNPTWTPDGKALLYKAGNPALRVPRKLLSFDPTTREERVFFSAFQFGAWALSPSGRQLAFAKFEPPDDVLLVAPSDSGSPHVVYRAPADSGLPKSSALSWTRDESTLLTPVVKKGSNETTVWQIPVGGGSPHPLFSSGRMGELRVSPNGKWLAFESRRREPEIWEMANFLVRAQ